MVYGEQGTNDDVTRNVCYNSPLARLGCLTMSRPNQQDDQQVNHHPHLFRSQHRNRCGIFTQEGYSLDVQKTLLLPISSWRNVSCGPAAAFAPLFVIQMSKI